MSINPIALKIAAPYARAFFDFVNDKQTLFETTVDLQNIQGLLFESHEVSECLSNPLMRDEVKLQILVQLLDQKLCIDTLQFLKTLIKRNRINLLSTIIFSYFELVYKIAGSYAFQVVSAKSMSAGQRIRLIQKIRSLTKSDRIMIEFLTEESLIGGFLIRNKDKVIDYTIKNKLKRLANQLDTALEL